jgi:hypothetical protein
MTILYLAYWGVNDGLTSSTVFPHIEELCNFNKIDKIIFVTIERNKEKVSYVGPKNKKIEFSPIYSKNLRPNILTKMVDFIVFPKELISICKKNKVKKIISRGAPAGALAYKVYKATNIPFLVESFEPHADYMLESGVWQKWNPKYIFEKRWEQKIKEFADSLITVSTNYSRQLVKEGVPAERIEMVPCCVNQQAFKLDTKMRLATRKRLGITNSQTVGIYVGKFGGIYYDQEAFHVFKKTYDIFDSCFFFIILSPDDPEEIKKKFTLVGIPLAVTFIDKVPHEVVPNYLSAADFAFSTIRPAPSRKFCCAIKNGEYWANGLPILTTEDVGDDTDIIKKENKGGVIFNEQSLNGALANMKSILKNTSREDRGNELTALAIKYRSFDILKSVYKRLI